MIGTALNRTWQQMLHPKFRSVFLTAILAAAATLGLLVFVLDLYWPTSFTVEPGWFDWEWFNGFSGTISAAGFWFLTSMASYLLFPPVVTLVMGLLIDKIATAVEEEHYPNRLGTRDVPYGDIIVSALKLALLMITVNLIALIPYIILFFMGGFGFIILFVAINGFLLGREYFEMVALRHMDRRAVAHFRVQHGGRIFVVGAMVAGMFLVPFLNILAPIVGAAVMTHIFHNLPERSGEGARR
ncbi:MAG: hypothetical protein COB37_01860 [Kordiimonadales bacterium]|nr:MAG: hypothetical protein COB37_01860 [Kordiimonadales bacterium]